MANGPFSSVVEREGDDTVLRVDAQGVVRVPSIEDEPLFMGKAVELLIEKGELNRIWILRKVLTPLSTVEAMELLLERLEKSKTNLEFLSSMSAG